MNILGIDASGQSAGAAILSEGRVLGEYVINNGLTHSQTLMPIIEHLTRITGFDLQQTDYIACTAGPGSFTGLRIGAACAKGLATGLGKRMVRVPTLDALAYNVYETEGCLVPMMDARRGQVYAALYRWEAAGAGFRLKRLSGYMAEDVGDVVKEAKALGLPITALGDGAALHRAFLLENGLRMAPASMALQRPASVAALGRELAEGGETIEPGRFTLMYVRKPQAEREYEAREGSHPGKEGAAGHE